MSRSHAVSKLEYALQTPCFRGWVLLTVIIFVTLFVQNRALAGQRYFAIQVSSNKKQQSAVTEVNRFKKRGYDAFYRHEKLKKNGSWYRVYVGRYGTREEALREANAMKKQGHISDYTIRAMADLETGAAPRKEASEEKQEKIAAKSGAGGAAFKFKAPGKKAVPRMETVPAGQDKDDSRGPLRRKGAVVARDAVHKMLLKHRFYSTCSSHNFDFCNPGGDFSNQFEDNGNGTITDRATQLMWQQGGSEEARTFLDALKYAKELNNKKFGGYSDWRVPTIEELASLLEPSWKNEDLFIDPVFDTKQKSCWSTDAMGMERAWNADFHLGYVTDDPMTFLHRVRAVRSVQ